MSQDYQTILWQQCARWLFSAEVLEIHVSDLPELAAALKDGVRLCKLANRLREGCVDYRQVLNVPGSSFSQQQNAQLFIDACRDVFKLSKSDLFEFYDLTELESFKKVINTLAALSHTHEALSCGLKPFPESISPSSFPSSSGEDIYCNLDTRIQDVDEKIYDVCQYSRDDKADDELYDRIVTKNQKPESKFETFVPTKARDYAIKELLQTESSYLKNCLEMLIKNFFTPLSVFLPEAEFKKIFCNLKDIYHIHNSFHSCLTKAVYDALGIEKRGEDDPGIGEAFIKYKTDFLAYAPYVVNIDEAKKTLDMIESYDETKRKLKELKEKSQSDFKLQDLLTVPFQRICKYHLLLMSIINSTTVHDMEREKLVQAFESCKDVVDFVNEAKRDDQNNNMITRIKRSVDGVDPKFCGDFETYGRLEVDGLVKVTDFHEKQIKSKQRHVFVFERCILICKKQKNGRFFFVAAYPLEEFSIEDSAAESPTASTKSTSTLTRIKSVTGFDSNTLSLVGGTDDAKIQMDFKSVKDKKHWKDVLKGAIDKSNPQAGTSKLHQLIYKTYTSPTNCSLCKKLLYGTFYQGYHCSKCNCDLHYLCINKAYCRGRSTPSRVSESSLNKGYRYIALETFKSSDPDVLSFDANDEIIIFGEAENGMLTGRKANCPGRQGIVSPSKIRALSCPHRDSISDLAENFRQSFVRTNPSVLSSQEIIKHFQPNIHNIEEYPWYFGIKDRNQANDLLAGSSDGTFIVRLSQKENKFIISVAYNGSCKHMKIERFTCPEGTRFFLHDAMIFSSIPDLIDYYCNNTLAEGFDNINTTLTRTLLKTRVYRVIFDYKHPSAETSKYLELKQGETVELIETTGEDKGWWRFQAGDRTGFFPMTYVSAVLNNSDDIENGG